MVVLNQIHRQLSGISDDLLADAVSNEGLLEQDITAIFFHQRGSSADWRLSIPAFLPYS